MLMMKWYIYIKNGTYIWSGWVDAYYYWWKNTISADKTESDATEPYVGLKDPSCSFMNKNINNMYSGSKQNKI